MKWRRFATVSAPVLRTGVGSRKHKACLWLWIHWNRVSPLWTPLEFGTIELFYWRWITDQSNMIIELYKYCSIEKLPLQIQQYKRLWIVQIKLAKRLSSFFTAKRCSIGICNGIGKHENKHSMRRTSHVICRESRPKGIGGGREESIDHLFCR